MSLTKEEEEEEKEEEDVKNTRKVERGKGERDVAKWPVRRKRSVGI
jgi:hypothetical protein